MARIVKDTSVKKYYNDRGMLHREDGPAVIWVNGTFRWYHNGQSYRPNDLPTDIYRDGLMQRYDIYAVLSSYNYPACDYPNGYKEWIEDDRYVWPKLK